jgi:hypothetical protein
MSARWVRWMLGGVCLTTLFGCNILSLPFFILGPEPKVEAGLKKIANDDVEKEVTVVVLTYRALETRPELTQADRELSRLLVQGLKEGFKYNKENVRVVNPTKVDDFKADHPDWHSRGLEEIGQHFQADYVIYLEMNKLSLYEPGSNNTLYRGRADISVSLIDVNKPGDGPHRKEFATMYPTEVKGALDTADKTPLQFRQEFLQYVARHLSWLFTAHPTDRDYECL